MAEALPFGRSIDLSSDNIPENYCEPCHEFKDEIKLIAGHCIDCVENLCVECFNNHLAPKLLRNHKLVDKSAKPHTQPKQHKKSLNSGEKCSVHGATIQSFCTSHSELCCKVCRTINHTTCDVEEISKKARNIQNSKELQILNKKMKKIQKGFEDNLRKTGHHELTIQKNFIDAINEMKKLRDEIDKLLNETEKLTEKVKEDEFRKIEIVSSTCNILIEHLNNITSNLDTLNEQREIEQLFISMKRAESQIKSLEDSLDTLNNEVREYSFQPDEKLTAMISDLKPLGRLNFTDQVKTKQVSSTKVHTIQQQMAKQPVKVKEIITKSASENDFHMFGTVALPNNQFMITDYLNKKVKQFDSKLGKFISKLHLSGNPFDVTHMKSGKVAVTVEGSHHIQLVSVTKRSLHKGKTIPVNGTCRGITFNDKDLTFIITFINPAKVEIINMTGTVLKTLDYDFTGAKLFSLPLYVELSPDMKDMYISDASKNSLTLLTLSGDIKTEYKDSGLQGPSGIYVHSSGVVYVVGRDSCTVQQIEPTSGEIKTLLEQKDGLEYPWSISYCEMDHKLYVGSNSLFHIMKVFDMK